MDTSEVNDYDSTTTIKIAYVTDNTQVTYANDTVILPGLQADSNFEVTEVQATFAGILPVCNTCDVVLISEIPHTLTSAGITELEGINKPVLLMDTSVYMNVGYEWNWANAGYGDDNAQTNITVTNTTHPIFTDIIFVNGNEVQMLTAISTAGLAYFDPTQFIGVAGGTISNIANVRTHPTQICILEISPGTSINGTTIPQRFIQIGIDSNSYGNVTNDALDIIKNTIYYLMEML